MIVRHDAIEYIDSVSKQQITDIFERVKSLEALMKQTIPRAAYPNPKNWLRRNASWFWPVLTLLSASGIFPMYIDQRIDAKLTPINKTLIDLRNQMSYIEGRLDLPRQIARFSEMPPRELRANLKSVAATINKAAKLKENVPVESTVQLRNNLALVSVRDMQFWETAVALINYQSAVAERLKVIPNIEHIRATTCNFLGGDAPPIRLTVSNVSVRGCNVTLDGLTLKDSEIENAIVTYNGGSLTLENVGFVNCLFIVNLPGNPGAPAQRLVEAILASKDTAPSLKLTTI